MFVFPQEKGTPLMDLTGNPLVDTGLMTLTAVAGKKSIEDLDFADIQTIFGNGDQLARQNQSLMKCFTMVFGTNGPLTQHAYKESGKNEEIYLSILRQLLDLAKTEGQAGPRCDLTGVPTNLDFHAVCAKALSGAGVPVPDKKWLGRDWVPLGGSLGNDAQALPAASRPLHVSALALFALQYLPLGVSLLKGKLTCYQSTETKLAQAWVTDIVKQNENRLSLGETEILGKGGGTGLVLDRLMRCFGDLSYSHIPGTQALLWLFSNSGPKPDCAIEEIPSSTLAFISNATASFGSEVRSLIAAEPKDSRQQLFECIRGGRDYPGLYSYKKHPGASPEFYDFYQREVRSATPQGLSVARKLARHILSGEEPKRLKEIRKPEFLRSPAGKSLVRKYIINYLTPGEYDALFPSEHHPIKANPAAWDQLRYYLTTQQIDSRPIEPIEETMRTTHPKIVQIAETYRGVEPRKIKNILDRMAQRKIGVRWLQDKFCRLAEDHKGWNFGEWDEFVCDEDGKVVAFELLFQIRLYLSNLYREVTTDGKGEAA